jgi:hypothetical protein
MSSTPYSKSSERLASFPEAEENVARFILAPLDPQTARPFPRDVFPPKRLQFWPETLTYDRGQIGWQEQTFPGSTHSLFSWTGNASPTLSFDAEMATDTDPAFFDLSRDDIADGRKTNTEIDLNAAVAWFVALTNPKYARIDDPNDFATADPFSPPPIVQIVPEGLVQGSRFNANVNAGRLLARQVAGSSQNTIITSLANVTRDVLASDGSRFRGVTLSQINGVDFYGVITSLSVTYEKFFISGFPRKVKLSLSFREVIQLGNTIKPHSRDQNLQVAQNFSLNVT